MAGFLGVSVRGGEEKRGFLAENKQHVGCCWGGCGWGNVVRELGGVWVAVTVV